MGIINTKEQLEEAIENGEDHVIVVGDFANKIITVKKTGKIIWAVAIVSLVTAIGFITTAPAVTVGIIRTGTITAIGIAVVAVSVGIIKKLKYNFLIVEKGENYVKLKLS